MHLNKLSTAALMRLTILASLNLIVGRMLDSWFILLHPLFFLMVLTLDLGLYAVMVYTGTLDKTLIAMMVTGLAGIVAIIAYAGAGPSVFMYGGPFREVGWLMERAINGILARLPARMYPGRPLNLRGDSLLLMAYLTVDIAGLAAVFAVGGVARALQNRWGRRESPASPPLDYGAASPL